MKIIFTQRESVRFVNIFTFKLKHILLLLITLVLSSNAWAQVVQELTTCAGSNVTLTTRNPNNGWFVQWESSSSIDGPYTIEKEKTKSSPNLTFTASSSHDKKYFRANEVNGGGQQQAVGSIYYITVKPVVIPLANITSSPTTPEVGKPVTYTVSSTFQTNGEAVSFSWQRSDGNDVWYNVGSNSSQFTMQSAPAVKYYLRCTLTTTSTGCYTSNQAIATTQEITPLPVEIIYFNAAKQGKDVKLDWATASELDNTGFEVQVSQDGANYRTLAFVETKNGNSSIKQNYSYTDTENGKYGTRYYRLKQIDTDGQFEYYTTKYVNFGSVSYKLEAFPNPFESEVKLSVQAEEASTLNIQVYDMLGNPVYQTSFNVAKGYSMEKITLTSSLPKGVYFVRTDMNGKTESFRLLKR